MKNRVLEGINSLFRMMPSAFADYDRAHRTFIECVAPRSGRKIVFPSPIGVENMLPVPHQKVEERITARGTKELAIFFSYKLYGSRPFAADRREGWDRL